ncbi:angiopoietin-related protein 5-like isoform 1-T2 [Discoglossus pictus]
MKPGMLPTSFAGFALMCVYLVHVNGQKPSSDIKGTDCSHILAQDDKATSGTYTIKPEGCKYAFEVYCYMDNGDGWTVIQRHNGQDLLSFDETWEVYKRLFGKINGEHWLGLDNINALTNQPGKVAKLFVKLEDYKDNKATAQYDEFSIEDEKNNYKLKLGKYSGNAGDGFRGQDKDTNQDGSYFSTKDKDNDGCPGCDTCPPCLVGGDIAFLKCTGDFLTQSGWWFNRCGLADLNGQWHENGDHIAWSSGIYWRTWNSMESLKSSEMMVNLSPKI